MGNSFLPSIHLLTCPRRAGLCGETLHRWARTDWGSPPRVHWDLAADDGSAPWGTAARARRLTEVFATMLRAVLAEPGPKQEWFLFLEDDLDFHPCIAARVRAWEALEDSRCCLASLFNPSLRAGNFPGAPANTFAAEPSSFMGAQAVLLRRDAAQRALSEWENLPGLQSQRLAALCGKDLPIWVHKPSLVQHMARDSSWGARVQRALDFDPNWAPNSFR